MNPCVFPMCPAFATRGIYCPVHAATAPGAVERDAETLKAIAQREKIRRMYQVPGVNNAAFELEA